MKLPENAIIATDKIADYLLRWRPENDKSQFLAQAGYTAVQPERLVEDIRQFLLLDAEFEEATEYGDKYRIVGTLTGPKGRALNVVTIWMAERATGVTKFITLYPAKEH
jgi:23S rRNA A2030 N6-methylase RlmJ